MSFGKNPQQLASIPAFNQQTSFRQQARRQQDSRPQKGNFKGAPYFVNQFKPNDMPGAPADEIRIIKGNYEVPIADQDGNVTTQLMYYYPAVEHYNARTKKGWMCSAGPLGAFKGKGDPCEGCSAFWADKQAGNKNGFMSRRELYVFSVLHFGHYYRIPQIGADGKTRTNDKGEPYLKWENIQQHERVKYKDYEQRDWNLLHWAMGFGHWNILCEYDRQIGNSCASCGGRDTIKTVVWLCPNPECGVDLIDPNTSSYSPQDLEKIVTGIVRCSHCSQEGYLQEMVECTSCSTPQRADIFDVNLMTKRVKDPNSSNNKTDLQIMGYSNPKPLEQRFLIPTQTEKGELPPIAHPIDLPRIYAPATIEEQLEMMGGGGNRTPVNPNQMSRSWGSPQAPVLGSGGQGQ